MEPNKHEPEVDPIISDTAARFTMALLLALFITGAALPIWRGLNVNGGGLETSRSTICSGSRRSVESLDRLDRVAEAARMNGRPEPKAPARPGTPGG